MRSSDIVKNCREVALRVEISGEWGGVVGTLREAAAEVERLRLTPEERGLMRVAATLCVLRGGPKTAAGLVNIADRLGGDR
jgi:hypothetical protein